MKDLDSKIADLEARLALLKAQRQDPNAGWSPPESGEEGHPLIVADLSDLRLDRLPSFARALLDAIPVQIFVKEATSTPERGRRYLYLNAAARNILGWNAQDVPDYFDSDAISGGFGSEEYGVMYEQESETLENGRSRRLQLEWTANSGRGTWRRNRTLEIPVLGEEGRPIGFCAIAEDIELQLLPVLHSWLRMVFEHEYNNAALKITNQVDWAERRLKEAHDGIGSLPEADLRVLIESARGPLRLIKQRARMSQRVAGVLIDAFAKVYVDEKKAASEVCFDLDKIYKDPPFDLEIWAGPGAGERMIRKPRAILGVIVELVANAIKHSREVEIKMPVRLGVEATEEGVAWVISNRAEGLGIGLKILKVVEAAPVDREREQRLGSAVISEILSRAFPAEDVERMIEFPDRLEDGWVHVRFNCSEKPNVRR